MGKSKGTKYSSYLDNLGELRLEKFCKEFECSKAKAISYLLELWDNGTISNKLATVNDDIYSQLENKLESFIVSKIDNQLEEVNQEITSLQEEVTYLRNLVNSS